MNKLPTVKKLSEDNFPNTQTIRSHITNPMVQEENLKIYKFFKDFYIT